MGPKVWRNPGSCWPDQAVKLSFWHIQTARIITHYNPFRVSAEVEHQLLYRAVMEHVVTNYAVLEALVNDSV